MRRYYRKEIGEGLKNSESVVEGNEAKDNQHIRNEEKKSFPALGQLIVRPMGLSF